MASERFLIMSSRHSCALMCIPRRPESRLVLQPVTEGAPTFWTIEDDYSVMWRDLKVGCHQLRSQALSERGACPLVHGASGLG
jgi:hypothetical protein